MNSDSPASEGPPKPSLVVPSTPELTTTQRLDQVERQMSAFEKSTLRWTRVAVFVSAVAALIVFAQWLEMDSQLSEMQKQTTLNRQQLVGSQAAVVEAVVEFSDPQNLKIEIRNTGHVIAKDVEVEATITMETLPDRSTIGQPAVRKYSKKILAPFTDRWDGDNYTLTTPLDYMASVLASKNVLVAKGTVTYDDGFPEKHGDKVTTVFCRAYFAFRGHGTTVGPQMVECDNLLDVLRDLQENDKRRQQ
jgi:hypothetical protein